MNSNSLRGHEHCPSGPRRSPTRRRKSSRWMVTTSATRSAASVSSVQRQHPVQQQGVPVDPPLLQEASQTAATETPCCTTAASRRSSARVAHRGHTSPSAFTCRHQRLAQTLLLGASLQDVCAAMRLLDFRNKLSPRVRKIAEKGRNSCYRPLTEKRCF